MVFVASVTCVALSARTLGGVSSYNLACNATIYCSISVLTFWISVREAFRAATSPSILAWGVAEAKMSSITSVQSFLIRHSKSVCCAVARMHAAYGWGASVVFSIIEEQQPGVIERLPVIMGLTHVFQKLIAEEL